MLVSKLIRWELLVLFPCEALTPCGSWQTRQEEFSLSMCRLWCPKLSSFRMLVSLWHLKHSAYMLAKSVPLLPSPVLRFLSRMWLLLEP